MKGFKMTGHEAIVAEKKAGKEEKERRGGYQ